MKTIRLNYLLLLTLSLFFLIACVAEKQTSLEENQNNTANRTAENNTRIEVCHNCQVKFKTTLLAQKMARNSPTYGFCEKCTAEYYRTHQ
jgi:protein involved in sex pheromone biosynthesis